MASIISIDDIAYELRQLLGANKVTTELENRNAGNLINYGKDSVYLHVRALYNFFSNRSSFEAKVSDFTSHTFDTSLYNGKWKKPLHNHALHMGDSRTHQVSNFDGTEYLNEQVHKFSNDIEGLWIEWISVTTDAVLKQELQDVLDKARLESDEDLRSFIAMLK